MDIAAVIVSFNSKPFLADCLRSLFAQEVPFSQVVVVDCDSRDGSKEVMDLFPRVRSLKLARNVGYGAAANRGIAAAAADSYLVANADTRFPPDFSRQVLEKLAQDPGIGLLSPLLLRFDEKTVDSAGQACSPALYPREVGFGRPLARVEVREGPAFSACGAATVLTRKALARLRLGDEWYDEDFFLFWEDFDLGWRAHLLGLRVHFYPRAVAFHFRSGTLERSWRSRISLALSRPAAIRFHLVKNRYLCLIKNFRWRRDWKRLPLACLKDIAWVGALTIASPKNIMTLCRAGKIYRRALEKRRHIRSHE